MFVCSVSIKTYLFIAQSAARAKTLDHAAIFLRTRFSAELFDFTGHSDDVDDIIRHLDDGHFEQTRTFQATTAEDEEVLWRRRRRRRRTDSAEFFPFFWSSPSSEISPPSRPLLDRRPIGDDKLTRYRSLAYITTVMGSRCPQFTYVATLNKFLTFKFH